MKTGTILGRYIVYNSASSRYYGSIHTSLADAAEDQKRAIACGYNTTRVVALTSDNTHRELSTKEAKELVSLLNTNTLEKQVAAQLLKGFYKAFGDDTVVTPEDAARMAAGYHRRYPGEEPGLLDALIKASQ